MHHLITGATGLIGQRLLKNLGPSRILSRSPERALDTLGREHHAFAWDTQGPVPSDALDGVRCVIHLAGEPVSGGRWTSEKKRRIVDSRLVGTRNLVDGMIAHPTRPSVLVAASAIGFYGDRGDEELNESSEPQASFMGELCAQWEKEAHRAAEFGIRVVCLRIGIVLSPEGGALKQMITPFKWGVGGRLGHGRQWMSWIHLEDMVNLIKFACKNDDLNGPINAVSPNPVTNSEFTKRLGHHLQRPTLFPVPRFVISSVFGEMADIVLASQKVKPDVAIQHGFKFKCASIDDALRTCFR